MDPRPICQQTRRIWHICARRRLQVMADLKLHSRQQTLPMFWIKRMAEYPEIATTALKSLLPFPLSYLCEAEFSAVAATKTTEQTGHKQHTSGVIVSYYPQIEPSRCKETS